MIDLDRLFENWFQDPEMIPSRKLSFAEDLRGRLSANNDGGVFNVILPQLDAALAFTGDTKMGPILFDQSRLYPTGSSAGAPVTPVTSPA